MNQSIPNQPPHQGPVQHSWRPYPSSGQAQGYHPLRATLKWSQGSFELGSSPVKVGRSSDSQLRVDDPEASWSHVQIHPQGQSHVVIDLGSTNGTFLNGQKLLPHTPYPLTNGDTLSIGNTMFSYTADVSVHPPTRIGRPISGPVAAVAAGFQQGQPFIQSVAPSGKVHRGQPAPLSADSRPFATNQAVSSNNRASTSHLQASLLLYILIVGVIVCAGGIVLSQYRILPTEVTSIATGLGGFMAFIAGIWTILGKLFPRDLWQRARKFPVITACIATAVILIVPVIYLYSLTDPYVHQGRLVLNDPLTSQSQYQWQVGEYCQFKEGAYHVSNNVRRTGAYGFICHTRAFKNLRDFVYEIKVKIIRGNRAGIVFRYNTDKNNYYGFFIAPDGKYWLEARENFILKEGSVVEMFSRPDNDYKIATVVQGKVITIYVNQELIVEKPIPDDLDKIIDSG